MSPDPTAVSVQADVDAPIDRAFETFTIGIGTWWDADKHILQAPLARMEFQPWIGGRIIDHGTDGSTCAWARILDYQAPDRVVFSWDIDLTWQIEADPARCSEVEIAFVALDEARTRVTLTHRHLDRHGEGWEGMRDAVASGWNLDGFRHQLAEPTAVPWVSDEQMQARLALAAPYTVVVLHPTDALVRPAVDPVIWAHGRRNMGLIAAGTAPVILPMPGEDGPAGIAVFTTDLDETRAIMDADPGVEAGIFTYEAHPARGFPGAALPAPTS